MASEQFSLCWDNFHKNMSSGMNSLLENEDLVDVTLAVEGKLLKAHKMVLSVCSPYFKELFKSNPCQHPIVFMKDVSYVAISDLLQFMYQGEVQVSQDNLTTFIKTAEALQIKGLTGDGNGSTDAEPEQPQERSFNRHSEETYKPASRPKKPLPNPIVTTTAAKRPRLSVSSNDSQSAAPPQQSITKTEPGTTLSDGGAQPVQFKMEPYDQNQSVTIPDDTGDENFGDDTLDDTAVDDTEDYSMMEGEEPQAGTSTDGAAEGQGLSQNVMSLISMMWVDIKDIKRRLDWKEPQPVVQQRALQELSNYFPVGNKQELLFFENQLNQGINVNEFRAYVEKIGGKNAVDFQKNVFTAIYSNTFAKENTWYGKKNQFNISELTVNRLIKETIQSKFDYFTASDFNTEGGEWFRLGSQRLKRKAEA